MRKLATIIMVSSAFFFLVNLFNIPYLLDQTSDYTVLLDDKGYLCENNKRVELTIVDVIGSYASKTTSYSILPIMQRKYYVVKLEDGSYISVSATSFSIKDALTDDNISKKNPLIVYGMARNLDINVATILEHTPYNRNIVSNRDKTRFLEVRLAKSKIRIIIDAIISLLIVILYFKTQCKKRVKDDFAKTHTADDLLEKLKEKE